MQIAQKESFRSSKLHLIAISATWFFCLFFDSLIEQIETSFFHHLSLPLYSCNFILFMGSVQSRRLSIMRSRWAEDITHCSYAKNYIKSKVVLPQTFYQFFKIHFCVETPWTLLKPSSLFGFTLNVLTNN